MTAKTTWLADKAKRQLRAAWIESMFSFCSNDRGGYMRGVLRILVIVLGLCGAAWAQNLSPRAFSETFVTEFRRAIPSATITRGDLQITVRRPSGSTTINLYNAYTAYSKEPQRLKELISAQLALVVPLGSAPANAEAKLDPSRIVPVIKGRAWLRELLQQIKISG